jgi:hypothetical protein
MELRKGVWYFLNGYHYHFGEPNEDLRLEITAEDDIEKVIETLSNTLRTIHAELNRFGICDDGISCGRIYKNGVWTGEVTDEFGHFEGILNEHGHCEDCVTERDYENDKFPKEE